VLTFSGPPPTISGVKFGFGTSPGDLTHPLLPGVVCFLEGTRIATSDAESARVESLNAGDLVFTADGRRAPVLWIGRQTVSRIFADPLRSFPIRIRAGALGDGAPGRDLLVSPCHALMIDGLLVQAGALVNGRSIVRETNVPETFVYYHLELESHD